MESQNKGLVFAVQACTFFSAGTSEPPKLADGHTGSLHAACDRDCVLHVSVLSL